MLKYYQGDGDMKRMKKLVLYGVISLVDAVLYVLVVPTFASNQESIFGGILRVIICVLVVVTATAFLFYEISVITFKKAFFNGLLVLFSFILVVLFIGLLFGIAGQTIYSVLKTKKALEEIKGFISVASRVLNILVMPIFVSGFWTVAKEANNAVRSFFRGLFPGILKYLKLVAFFAALNLLGHFLESIGIFSSRVGSIAALTLMGVALFYLTENVCCGFSFKKRQAELA